MLPISNNTERREFWEYLHATYPGETVAEALETLPPIIAEVLHWHYTMFKTLREIMPLVNRSIASIRNHQTYGIYCLYQYFEDLKGKGHTGCIH